MTDSIATGRPRSLRRTVASAVSVTLVGGAALAVWFAVTAKPRTASTAAPVPTATAPVTRGSVTQWIRIPGTYGFDGAYQVVHQAAPGILTRAAEPGITVNRGGVLYAVDNKQVRLLYGSLPAYRDFASSMANGPDVRQLEQNLVDLGLDPLRQVTVDNRLPGPPAPRSAAGRPPGGCRPPTVRARCRWVRWYSCRSGYASAR